MSKKKIVRGNIVRSGQWGRAKSFHLKATNVDYSVHSVNWAVK